MMRNQSEKGAALHYPLVDVDRFGRLVGKDHRIGLVHQHGRNGQGIQQRVEWRYSEFGDSKAGRTGRNIGNGVSYVD